jgi:hypothetical protein
MSISEYAKLYYNKINQSIDINNNINDNIDTVIEKTKEKNLYVNNNSNNDFLKMPPKKNKQTLTPVRKHPLQDIKKYLRKKKK